MTEWQKHLTEFAQGSSLLSPATVERMMEAISAPSPYVPTGFKSPSAKVQIWGFGTVLKHRNTSDHLMAHGNTCPCRVMVVNGVSAITLVSNDGEPISTGVAIPVLRPEDWERIR